MDDAWLRTYLQAQIDAIPQLPCRVDDMTPREFTLFQMMTQALGALTSLRDRLNDVAQYPRTEVPMDESTRRRTPRP
jgi:hypothetical protein